MMEPALHILNKTESLLKKFQFRHTANSTETFVSLWGNLKAIPLTYLKAARESECFLCSSFCRLRGYSEYYVWSLRTHLTHLSPYDKLKSSVGWGATFVFCEHNWLPSLQKNSSLVWPSTHELVAVFAIDELAAGVLFRFTSLKLLYAIKYS